MGPIGCPETSEERNYHCTLRKSQKGSDLIYIAADTWNQAIISVMSKQELTYCRFVYVYVCVCVCPPVLDWLRHVSVIGA
jgi:hypothetical protein